MKKLLLSFSIILLSLFGNISFADYIQTSDPQGSEVLGAEELLKADNQNEVITDIAKIIVDIGNLKDYVDDTLSSIWTDEITFISYNDKDVYFGQNLQVVDTIKADKLIIGEGAFKDQMITTDEIVNGQIKKEDLSPEIFNSLSEIWKRNGNTGYYNQGNVGMGTSSLNEKLVINGNIKFDTPDKGIIFPDGSIQTTGLIDESNNVKLTGDQNIHGIKTFKKPIQLKNGVAVDTLSGDINFGTVGEYCASEGNHCDFTGKKRVIYGANGKYLEGIKENGVTCNNGLFGDPIPGIGKNCYISDIGDDSLSNKYLIKNYIDNNLGKGKISRCGTDNGKDIELDVIKTSYTTITNVQKYKTTFDLPNGDTISTNRCPQVTADKIYVDGNCGNDERLFKREKTPTYSYASGDSLSKFTIDYEGTIDTNDCRGLSVYTQLYKDSNNLIQLNARSSRKSSRSYQCSGTTDCNNKNFGAGGKNSNWSCVGDSCNSGSWLDLYIEQNDKKWRYIFMLNSLSSGNYRYYNDVDLKNKKWKIKVTDLSGNIKYDTTVDLPNPTTGIDFNGFTGDYKTGVGTGRTCGSSAYTKILKFAANQKDSVSKTKLTFPINLSSVSNFCKEGSKGNYECIYTNGSKGTCNDGDIKTKNIAKINWICDNGSQGDKPICGVNMYYQGINLEGIFIVDNGGIKEYSNGDLASSCNQYRHPSNSKYIYDGNIGSGMYKILTSTGDEISVYCDMETDGGGYTMYNVDSGIRTYRSTDNNTCKELGMDIFVPRTKEHFKSALDKYGTSYFTFVGVSKPSDGGNYTNVAMNSVTASDRKAVDGGKWWLRDSKYSEPNGDYTANCWLNIYDWNVDNLRFNDAQSSGNCRYSAVKYLCSTNDK